MDQVLIEGVLITPEKRIANPKGDILHALKRSGPGYVDFGEAYFSFIFPQTIKGWKRHRRVTLNFVVPVGTVRVVIYDDRPGSYTTGRFSIIILGEEYHARLTISPGLWVAFQGRDDLNILLNIMDEEHDPTEADTLELESIPFDWRNIP